jgi:hypothetical protein
VSTLKLPHCAELARQLGERPTGTASRITSLLLIEHTGPWSADVRERVVTGVFGPDGPERTDQLHIRLGLRVLIIRRPGRATAPVHPTVFVAGCRTGRRWLERLAVSDLAELADLDLPGLAESRGGWGEPVDGPLLLVCAHGRKDACCAILGRPVADALADRFPEQTWQCTHFGGDRWAGNLLVAPLGHMYGQLDRTSAAPAATAAQRGEVRLENLRGRVGISPFAQVAEIAVRERTGLMGVDDVLAGAVRTLEVEDGRAQVEVRAGGAEFRVLVRRRPMEAHGRSVCAGETHPHRFDVLELHEVVPQGVPA